VHRAIGQQSQDGCADVAALSASPPAAAAARAAETSARIEAETTAAGPESEAGLKAGAEWAVPVGAVLAEVVPELTTGVPPLLV
jgi:hypothetical protein